ncbi:hypothetical protein [Hyphomonas sp. UBA4494]|jgi:hypothetical protein|uniref:hypothetical protein n=1 Tax=Hyphomonas sp. UBA4494 TaxID=1946631 RepID=UPI0025C3F64A|nr:hypothetical protein [Hyphomonas sp. UBA4494]
MTKPASEITFNLTDFKQRAARVRESLGVSEATLSKQLFNGDSKPLPNIMAGEVPDLEKTYPRLDTLLRADQRLAELEADCWRRAGDAAVSA